MGPLKKAMMLQVSPGLTTVNLLQLLTMPGCIGSGVATPLIPKVTVEDEVVVEDDRVLVELVLVGTGVVVPVGSRVVVLVANDDVTPGVAVVLVVTVLDGFASA
jgi:hypothetical protein